jgi:glutathione S-transferase
MKLYLHPASPNCMSVLMAARHLRVPLERHFIDLMAGEQREAAYLAVNPNGTVPTLCDDGFVLWETIAILQYLAARQGDTPLWPRNERTRADIARWQTWSLAHWTPALQPYVFENLFKGLRNLGGPDAAVIRAADAQLRRYGGILDTHLRDREWVVGERLTLADISLSAYLMYAEPARIPLDDFANIRRWFEGIQTLPTWRAVQPQARP